MDIHGFATMVLDSLPFEPTGQQIQLVAALARFCSSHTPHDSVFILNGYAGTGKTSVMGALVRALAAVHIPTVLLASTGRAAKVFSNFTGIPAHTIHRRIYRAPSVSPEGRLVAKLNQNPCVNTVFIVDEASMIGDGADGGMNLLEDLVMYVYTGVNCKLILLGDTAQLPPVGLSESPAMNPEVLKGLGLRVTRAVMTATVRQKRRSGILYNATMLRRSLQKTPLPEPELRITGFEDMSVVAPEDLEDALQRSMEAWGESETIIITRSNRRAVDFNLAVRSVIYEREELLVKGERVIVSKNNYYWTRRSVMAGNEASAQNTHAVCAMDFVANGEAAVIDEVYATEERGGMVFADVRMYFPDHDFMLDAKLNLDTLTTDTANLHIEKQQRLFDMALAAAGLRPDSSATSVRDALKTDPYYNALQVKYAYAVTCHKAQGGQWASVFIDMGYIQPEAYCTVDFYRWLYTATSRATRHLSLVNPAISVI